MQIKNDDNAATLHALFPTLVYHVQLENHSRYREAFQSLGDEFQFDSKVRGDARYSAGEYHGQILLHQSKLVRPFFETLGIEVGRYLRVLGMISDRFEMQCLKSWFVLCEPETENEEKSMVTHNHSCSDVSWVYYVDVPEKCSPITFHAGSRLNTAPFDSAFHYDWHNEEKSAVNTFNWWNSETWSIHPRAGDLLLFPGKQLHSVEANHSQQTRVSVAGDIALTLREQFTDLEFGRTARKHWLSVPLS